MKKALLALAAVAVILTACGSSTDTPTTPAKTVTVAAPAPPAPAATKADVVREILAGEGIQVSSDNADIDAAGEATCSYFDDFGVSASTLTDVIYAAEQTFGSDGATVAGTLAGAYCPEYLDEVQAVADGYSTGIAS
jgi:ABC-type proline/glycine betaine transport system substrate-binding protein